MGVHKEEKTIQRKWEINIKNEITIFENQNIKLEVNMQDEIVWLSLEQMADLLEEINQLFLDI